MSPDLFRSIVDVRPATPGSRLSALPASVFIHVLVLVAVLMIPILAPDALPLIAASSFTWIQAAPAPTVPAPPPAVRPTAIPSLPNPDAAPLTAPAGIPAHEGLSLDHAAPQGGGVGVDGGVVDGGTRADLNLLEAPPPPLPTRPTEPVRAGGIVKIPVRSHDVRPIYPEVARIAHVEGTVVIEAIISTTGDVVQAKIIKSKALLDEAALTAVRQWKYTPTLLDGVPVPVVMTVSVTFRLQSPRD